MAGNDGFLPKSGTSSRPGSDLCGGTLRESCRLLSPPAYGRSAAFRRLILDLYDHQCAACGLRVRLPTGNEVSFIDAAHHTR